MPRLIVFFAMFNHNITSYRLEYDSKCFMEGSGTVTDLLYITNLMQLSRFDYS